MGLEIRRNRAELTPDQSDIVDALKTPAIPLAPPAPPRIIVTLRGGERLVHNTYNFDSVEERDDTFDAIWSELRDAPPHAFRLRNTIFNWDSVVDITVRN